ncbi:1-acyl-sn-glycerol-3-phosphate acyltransferase [Bordetella sp. FB-8]|uniref:lysophospholipid acyltransferase family protein n=1 Tax=Bordetella sp. FB-8 TaxID=1159870 RepID=UPI001E3CE95D|nr:lysophospholipid acyltransferase family protein [Bordetella sp. FB-8]
MPALRPPRQDYWLWRLIATGLSFALFGLGGLALRVLVFPLQRLLPGDARTRQRRARLAIRRTFSLLVRFMIRAGVIELDFKNADRLGRPGQLVIANHPSLLDVVLLVGHIPDANCVVKHKLAANPFTRGSVQNAGYITNDLSMEMLDRAAQVLRRGETLLMFPEGTRTPLGSLPRFHRGACAIALRGAGIVTPVVIRMTPRSLTKGEPWWRIPNQRIRYTIEVGADLDPRQWLAHDLPPAAGRKMNDFLHTYFEARLTPDDCPGTRNQDAHH